MSHRRVPVRRGWWWETECPADLKMLWALKNDLEKTLRETVNQDQERRSRPKSPPLALLPPFPVPLLCAWCSFLLVQKSNLPALLPQPSITPCFCHSLSRHYISPPSLAILMIKISYNTVPILNTTILKFFLPLPYLRLSSSFLNTTVRSSWSLCLKTVPTLILLV